MTTAAELRNRSQRRQLIVQVLIVFGFGLLIWGSIESARTNLATLGITSGFGFLERGTGWSYSFAIIPASIEDSYARTLTIGFLNTLFLGSICIFLSTILGFIVGSIRDSTNLALNTAAAIFIQLFRNIPLILQAIFWYAVMIHMPGPRQAFSAFDTVYFSNRGLWLPALNVSTTSAAVLTLLCVSLAFVLIWRKTPLLKGAVLWVVGAVFIWTLGALFLSPAGEATVSVPALQGLRFVGGLSVSIELATMIVAIVLYGSAYIAEVVRGGLAEVPKGQIEAGQALGLRASTIWSQIKLPMALRTILPPLGNQWIFIMKATTIGIAIGFSDLFMIVTTSITQSGQTLELIAILAGAFLLVNFTIAQVVNWLNARLQLKAN